MVEIKDRPSNSSITELEKTFQDYKNKLENAEQEAQQIIDLAGEKADTIFKENQSKTQKTADEMIQAAKENCVICINETYRLIDEVSQKAENILGQFQKQLQSEVSQLITRINKIKDNPNVRSVLTKNEASASYDKKISSDNFRGQTKIVVIPPYNEVQTKELTELLKQIPGIKIDGTSTMEDNFSISLSIVEAIPLKKILSSISLVESSEFTGAIIKLKLKRYKIGGVPYY
jgi:F0F1-type ATP synthase membrane subunit b/b'